jgi:class 3 adenylate cyclase
MPMYLDRHDIEGATAEDVARAHMRDLEVQEKYGVQYLSYWFEPAEGAAFCFVDAPSEEAAIAVHREAHGLVPARIVKVDPRTLTQFLGSIHEPEPGEAWVESAFRTILFTDIENSTQLSQRLGDAKHMAHLRVHDEILREALAALGGTEVKHTGDGIMASFASVASGVECAIAIQRKFTAHCRENPDFPFRVRVGLSAGEPVTEHDDLFGAAVALADRVCKCAEPGHVLVSSAVRELCLGKGFVFSEVKRRRLKGFDEPLRLYEVLWQDS